MYLRLTNHLIPTFVCAMALAGCWEAPLEEGELRCDPDQLFACPSGYVCKPHTCPDDYRCYQRQPGDRDHYPMGCVVDGVCDAVTCETLWTCSDCCQACDPVLATSVPEEYLVNVYQVPPHSEEARDYGVDLDGDGNVENKWSAVASLLDTYISAGLNEEIADQIAGGHLLIAARVFRDYPAGHQDVSLVQMLLAEVNDATPVFDGADDVRLAPDASTDVGLCGRDSQQEYGSPFPLGAVRFPVPWPGRGGTVVVDLHRFFVTGDVSASGWQEIRVGGGISPAQVRDVLLPMLADQINQTIAAGPSSMADTLEDLFDGCCTVLENVPGCEAVVAGVGECDDTADPAVITVTELRCNALLHSAMSPDIDSDGDGVWDLISFGARLSAVPVTIVEN